MSTTDRRVGHQRVGRGDLLDPLVGGLVGAAQLSRRDLLRWAALIAGTLGGSQLLAACGAGPDGAAGGPNQQAPSGSLRALVADVPQLSILNAQSQLPAGRSRFAFGLAARPTGWSRAPRRRCGSPRTRPAGRLGRSRHAGWR